MLCFASGEIINLSNFALSLDISQPTVKKYMGIVEGTFIWRMLRSYEKKNGCPFGIIINNGDKIFMLSEKLPRCRQSTCNGFMQTEQSIMPVVFFGHGSPANALEDNEATQAWYRIANSMERPETILCISAHWYTRGSAVTAMEKPETIHDFGWPLPAPLFDLQYPAPGKPELAQRVRELLAPVPVQMDQAWGLDHGTWSVLIKAYPEAEIPVVQLSLDLGKPLHRHYELGQRLRPLRREGILIMGSGNIVHNLALMDWSNPAAPCYDWAVRFNNRIKGHILDNDPQAICEYQRYGRDASLAVPSAEHLCPLLYTLGAREETDTVSIETDFFAHKSLSMTSVVFRHQVSGNREQNMRI